MEEKAKSVEEATLFPAKQVRLLSGEYVTVEPWGLDAGELLGPRVAALFEELDDVKGQSVAKLVREHQREVREVVRETLGWTSEEMSERLKYEDLFTLAQAVIEVCILRGKDMGGVVGKAIALGLQSLPRSGASGSPEPSSSS